MSDMSNLYRAYSAVHNEEVKQELTENRDLISEMNMTQMLESDLVEVCEEIVEGLFEYGLDLDESCDVVVSVLEESVGGERNGLRDGKITQIAEAFETVFGTVTDKAERNCEKEFLLYRKNKPLTEKWNNKVSHETGNKRLHESLIASDRHQIKFGLIEMISDVIEGMHRDAKTGEVVDKAEVGKTYYPNMPKQKTSVAIRKEKEAAMKKEEVSTLRQGWGDAYSAIYEKKLDPVGQEDGDIDNDGDEDSSDKYLAKRRKAISKAMKKEEVENVEERWVGKHGQFDTEYARSRSPGGKMISGDDKRSGAEYTHGRRVKVDNSGMQPDVGGKTKPKSQGKMDAGTRADLQYRKAELKKKANLKKEEVSFSEAELARIEEIVNSWED